MGGTEAGRERKKEREKNNEKWLKCRDGMMVVNAKIENNFLD